MKKKIVALALSLAVCLTPVNVFALEDTFNADQYKFGSSMEDVFEEAVTDDMVENVDYNYNISDDSSILILRNQVFLSLPLSAITIYFSEDSLASISYSFNLKDKDGYDCYLIYKEVEEKTIERYGKPTKSKNAWRNEKKLNIMEALKEEGDVTFATRSWEAKDGTTKAYSSFRRSEEFGYSVSLTTLE